jgi:serine/threonine protein kinase
VRIALDWESNPIAVKRAKNSECAALIHMEAAILAALKHPLVLGLRTCVPGMTPSLVTESAGNGSFTSFLAAGGQRRSPGPNRIAKVIAGIALAMRFAHSRGTVHRDLSPENIFLDWVWTGQIADFGDGALLDAPRLIRPDAAMDCPSIDSRYRAPECHHGTFRGASEILAGRPAFPDGLNECQIVFTVAIEIAGPEIPESVLRPARALIEDCWAADPILALRGKMAKFVKRIEDWEKQNGRE